MQLVDTFELVEYLYSQLDVHLLAYTAVASKTLLVYGGLRRSEKLQWACSETVLVDLLLVS